jgi:hypothetical protein
VATSLGRSATAIAWEFPTSILSSGKANPAASRLTGSILSLLSLAASTSPPNAYSTLDLRSAKPRPVFTYPVRCGGSIK